MHRRKEMAVYHCQKEMSNNTPVEEETSGHSPRIIVQGGGFSTMLGDLANKYRQATKDSAKKGYAILTGGGTAVDAVEAAVCVLEDDKDFNAGCGSLLNNEREVECDAMIMDGNTLENGSVISGRHFRNPVSLAKKIMQESKHCALSGEGALKFAIEKKFPICNGQDLITERAQSLNVKYPDYEVYMKHHYKGEPVMACQDTVSAVAMDANGHFACATSTGGIAGKYKGRVGDAPLVGCGGYANECGAATTTGQGESIIKMTLAREVVYMMEGGKNAQESADNAVEKMKQRVDGYGGVIVIDKQGGFGKAFNTTQMVWASIENNRLVSAMERDGEVEREQVNVE